MHTDFNEDATTMQAMMNPTTEFGIASGATGIKELEYQRRISSLEDKVKQAYLELQNENALRNLTDESLKLLQKHHDDLRTQFDFTRDDFFKQQMKLKEQDETIRQSVGKAEAERI